MKISFVDLLKKYRDESLSEAEKGTKFEELIRAYMLMLPEVHLSEYLYHIAFCQYACYYEILH